jgi:ATP-binding cassette subfamily F protein uup
MKQQMKRELDWVRKAPRARGSKSVKRTANYYELEQDYATKKAIAEGAQKRLNLEVKTRRLGNKVIQIQSLHKAFGEKIIVDDFSYLFKS